MPVTIKEYVKLKAVDGTDHEGIGVATNLTAIEENGTLVYGVATGLVKVRTTVVCDNEHCINSVVNEEFKTVPATIEFDDDGDKSADFIKKVADIVIISDYKNQAKAYCCADCYASMIRKEKKSRIIIPDGMGVVR